MLTILERALGKISITVDTWTAETMKKGFLGVTAHWIDVVDCTWMLHSAVICFKCISGDHSGLNLGRYVVGVLDRVGIIGKDFSKVTKFHTHRSVDSPDKICYSFTRQHSITPQVILRCARQSRISTYFVSLKHGLQAQTSFHEYIFTDIQGTYWGLQVFCTHRQPRQH